ncbi:MAG: rRNA maturation RNase YbeY [Clostridia bacterium]|nr:rRNA maturation RNase YbeY [Clostridia bacterium]
MIKIWFSNLTGTAFDRKTLNAMKKVIEYTILSELPEAEGEVSLTVCCNEHIQKLNAEYRNIDAPTDVLSFPTLDFETEDGYVSFGDVVISTEKAYAQAEEYGHSPMREFCFLCVHSALHLMGYDHVDDEEGRIYMERRQEEVLLNFGINR